MQGVDHQCTGLECLVCKRERDIFRDNVVRYNQELRRYGFKISPALTQAGAIFWVENGWTIGLRLNRKWILLNPKREEVCGDGTIESLITALDFRIDKGEIVQLRKAQTGAT